VSKEFIRIGGAREHNLKNLTLQIPRDKLVVVTGLSGSGKSSLAFDTIYAEGQRKYVESLSAYARQFLDQLQKPDVDFIEGLSPAIAIEQRSSGSSPRSIIATTTEIYDYLRLLYAHIGQAHCPETGVPISTQSTSDIVDKILALPPKTKVMLLAPVVRRQKGEFRDVLERLAREGFVRARVDGEFFELGDTNRPVKLDKKKFHNIEAVVDRLVMDDKIRVRLGDSVETALRWGEGVLLALHQEPATKSEAWIETLHSNKMCSPVQCTGGRVPGLPRPRPENDFRRRSRRAGHGIAAGRRDPAVAARGQTADDLLQGDVAFDCRTFWQQRGNALQGFAGRLQKSFAQRFG
jgi:excinuclease ABC subunit A